jgi:hypothetical protein
LRSERLESFTEGIRGSNWKSGKERQTLVEPNTVFRRGKSAIPASRMEIEESRRVREERRDVTDALSEAADEDWFAILLVVWNLERGSC